MSARTWGFDSLQPHYPPLGGIVSRGARRRYQRAGGRSAGSGSSRSCSSSSPDWPAGSRSATTPSAPLARRPAGGRGGGGEAERGRRDDRRPDARADERDAAYAQADRKARARRSSASTSTDPLCCPSRATFFSGQYAHNTGVISNGGPNALAAFDERQDARRSGCRTPAIAPRSSASTSTATGSTTPSRCRRGGANGRAARADDPELLRLRRQRERRGPPLRRGAARTTSRA